MRITVLFGILWLCCVPLFINAQSSSSDVFTIKLVVGDDTTAPSTPTITAATPLGTDSIEIAWSTSTDNFALGGYQLFRDASHIATTTQTSFTDTGLTASTTYTYEVRAFDTSFNYSATSSPVSTTTLSIPVVATSTDDEVGEESNLRSRRSILVNDFTLGVSTSSATLEWETNLPTTFSLRWGRTTSYELGYVSTISQSTNHLTYITDLAAGATYHYELISLSGSLLPTQVSKGTFTTKTPVDTTAPPNVRDLQAVVIDGNVQLSWLNPTIGDFAGVRILRNHFFYPNDTVDGILIYQGTAETVTDEDALSEHATQYYTVYAYDANGNVSSGAVVFARQTEAGASPADNPGQIVPEEESRPATVATPLPFDDVTVSTPSASNLSPADIELWQGTTKATFADENIELSAHIPYIIKISQEVLPDHLKSIIVTMTDPSDNRRSYSFLLSLNKSGSAYEALIEPPVVIGQSKFSVDVYDFRTRTVSTVSGRVTFSNQMPLEETFTPFFPDVLFSLFTPALKLGAFSLTVLLLLLLLLLVRRRAREDKTSAPLR